MHRKGLVIGILILLIGVNIGSTFAGDTDVKTISSVSFDGNTLYVGGSGPNNYTKIQDAIDNATDGDTVFVYDDSSPYYENIVVNKSINLIGENRDTTIIDANGVGSPIVLKINGATISDFTLQNSGNDSVADDAGISIYVTNNHKIFHNQMIHNYDGIFLHSSDNNVISDNIIMNNQRDGLHMANGGENNTISDNIISNNQIYGIYMYSLNLNKITNNLIDNNIDRGNLFIQDCQLNTISGNIISNGSLGLSLLSSLRNIVEKNIIIHNDIGMEVSESRRNLISQNNFIENIVHATFDHILFEKCITIGQINTWYRNYWDDHNITNPKKIEGIMTFMIPALVWAMIFDIYPSIWLFKWINIDWNPAQEPYDIEV